MQPYLGNLSSTHHCHLSLDDYNSGIISLVKAKNSEEYTIARYFTNNDNVSDEIDLSQITYKGVNISNKITSIGPEAFAKTDNNQKSGFYFILPESVTNISERAFFHHAENKNDYDHTSNGVRIVTYRDSNGVIQPSDSDYSTIKTACINNAKNNNTRKNIEGYCSLPNDVTTIGRDCFYNNSFGSVSLGENITFLGHTAFFTMANYSGKTGRSHLSEITFAANSNFEVVNNGIYYKGTNKMLLHQAQNPGENTSLTISAGTKAIGMAACAGSMYKTINLNSDLKTIYGMAFQFSMELETIGGGTGLQYISAMAPGDEVYDTSMPFDNIDFRSYYDGDVLATKEARYGAFRDCQNLKTINLKAMTSLKKIGHQAFNNCPNLEQCLVFL